MGVACPLVLSLPPGAQGDNLHPTRRSVFLYWGSGPGQSNDWRTGPFPSAGGQDHLLEQEQGASLEQQSASKAGECSFSLKLTIFLKLYDYI